MPAVTVYLLNLFDLACTLTALRLGAVELNPLMESVPVMAVYKVVVVGGLLWWLSRRPEKLAKTGLRLCTAAYTILACYHIICLICIGGMKYGL